MPRIGPLDPKDPREIGGYRLKGRIGIGGQGVVYLAQGPSGEDVALKLLATHLPADESVRRRFRAEIEAMRRVAPFCTAQVLDADLDGDRPYIVSEYVDGASLEAYIAEHGPRSGGALDRIAVGTATALAAIHHVGVVHRDFKPQNVLMGPDGLRVIDFGIARLMGESLTTSRVIIGTPAYMAPEQISGGRAGPAADMFGWAATVAYAATGRVAFDGDTYPAVLWRIMYGEPDLDGLTGHLRDLVVACLAKEPGDRLTADEVLHALRGSAAPAGGAPVAPRPDPGPPGPEAEETEPVEARTPGPPTEPAGKPAAVTTEPVRPRAGTTEPGEPRASATGPGEPPARTTRPESPSAATTVPDEPVTVAERSAGPEPPPSGAPRRRDRGKAVAAIAAALTVSGIIVGAVLLTSLFGRDAPDARIPMSAASSQGATATGTQDTTTQDTTPTGGPTPEPTSSESATATSGPSPTPTPATTRDTEPTGTPSTTPAGSPGTASTGDPEPTRTGDSGGRSDEDSGRTTPPSPPPTKTKSPPPTKTKKRNPAPSFAGTWTGSLRRLATGTIGPVSIRLTKAAAEGRGSASMSWGAGYRCTATITRVARSDTRIAMRLSGVRGRAGYTGCFGGTLVLTNLRGDSATVLVLDPDGSTRMAGSARR